MAVLCTVAHAERVYDLPEAADPSPDPQPSPSQTCRRAAAAPPARGLDFKAALDWLESGRSRSTPVPRRRRYLVLQPTSPADCRAPAGIPEGTVLAAFDSLELMLQFVRGHAALGHQIQVFDTQHAQPVPLEYLLPR